MHTNSAVLLSAAAVLLLACDRDTEPSAVSPTTDLAQQQLSPEVRRRVTAQLDRFSTMPMLLAAERMDMAEVRGKSVTARHGDRTHGRPKTLTDVPVAAAPNADENDPTVAANPKKKKLLVAGSHFVTDVVHCEARHSSDGGRSWSAPAVMPQLTATSQCSDPVLAYSPDGRRVFYAYMDIKDSPADYDILVSYSTDDGASWVGPFIALDAAGDVFLYDKPWIATPDDASNYVYVTATRFDLIGDGDCHIAFARSTNGGTAYGAPQALDHSTGGCGVETSPVVQGSRPAGGKHGNVLVAWYNSGNDGWLNGSFNIRTSHSADFGATFGPAVDAVTDASETPFWKGPFSCYARWWLSMGPSVDIDAGGGAHIAYTHDPVPGSETPEDGDIRYATSRGAPYTTWSRPITINDDGTASAQGFVALDVKSGKPQATWIDARLPTSAAPECNGDVQNLFYDVFSSTRQGHGWSTNVRVTGESSRTDFIYIGDYIDLAAAARYSVWTDRRDKFSIFDFEDDVWGSGTHRVQSVALR
jgi:hypothetical protein